MALEMTVHELKALLKFSSDKEQAKEIEKQIGNVEKKLKDTEKAAQEATQKLNAMRENAEKLQQVGTTLAVAGTAMLTPMLLAAKTYRDEVGKGEAASAKWAAAQERLHEVQVRIGRETTEVMAPLLEKGVDLADKFADTLEKNPWITKAILAGGATLVTAGGVITMVAQVQRTVATVQLLTNSINAANLATIGTKLGTLATTLGPLALAITGLVALLNTEFGKKGVTAGAQFLTGTAGTLGTLIGGNELGEKWLLSIGRLTGAIQEADAATQSATTTVNGVTTAQLKLYVEYQKTEREAEQAYQQQRSTILSQARSAQVQADAEYQRNRVDKVRDFYAEDRQSLADYYTDRLRTIRDANDDAVEAEENHQREMARLTVDHDERMQDLSAARDALGMVREMRSAERQRREAESNYQAEVAQRNQQLAKQLADAEADFQEQREQKYAQFEQSLKDDAEQHELQRKQNQQAMQEQLRDLETQYRQEKARRRQAFTEQLQDTADALTQERLLKQKFSEAMLADLRAMIAQVESGSSAYPSRAVGGYVNQGLYNMHAGEFVLTNRTTQAAERANGGRLTQESVMQLLAGRSVGNQVTYVDNKRINSRLSSQDRAMINRDMEVNFGGLLGG
jgi:DNA repair exonuclease SbcCD ATPase subunit